MWTTGIRSTEVGTRCLLAAITGLGWLGLLMGGFAFAFAFIGFSDQYIAALRTTRVAPGGAGGPPSERPYPDSYIVFARRA